MIGKFREIISPPYSPKDLISIGLTLLLLLAVPVTVISVKQARDQRSRASEKTQATQTKSEFVKDEILLKFKDKVTQNTKDSVISSNGLTKKSEISQIKVQVLKVNPSNLEQVLAALKNNPNVEYAEKNYIAQVMAVTPNDTFFADYQWGPKKINGPVAWGITTGSSSVVVAILDSGITANHADLIGKLTAGYDFVHNDTNPEDNTDHGTHVSGIIGANTNNALGIAGMSWGARIMPVKVCDISGCPLDSITNGVIYAADNGARIMNLSLGLTQYSQALQDAIIYAHNKDSLIIAAAGNSALAGNPVIYPAAMQYVLSVGATAPLDIITDFSSFGSFVDVAAPGLAIYSTTSYGYASMTGTSMASPHVAGLAALIFSVAPFLTPDQVENIIESSSVDLGTAGKDDYYGWGRVDAYAALVKTTQDSDSDGFSNAVELYLGTNPNLKCGVDAWPPDINNDGAANVLDILRFKGKTPSLVGTSPELRRLDLNADGAVNVTDILWYKGKVPVLCTQFQP